MQRVLSTLRVPRLPPCPPAAAIGSARPASSSATPTPPAPKYKGAAWKASVGKWSASFVLRGKRIDLGLFDTAKDASDAYVAAKVVAGEGKKMGGGAAPASPSPPPPAPTPGPDGLLGVVPTPGGDAWEAVLTLPDGRVVSGGEFSSPAAAGAGYDSLARMYLGPTAPTNAPLDAYSSWLPPSAPAPIASPVPRLPGVPLTPDDIVLALTRERGVDISVLDCAGKTDLTEHMVFVTGTSVAHMGRLADAVATALRGRALPGVDASVEGRDSDDWMVVDCGNVIVVVSDADTRTALGLEQFYAGMKLGVDPYEGMTYDEWLDANPIPEVWLQKHDRDEEEAEADQRIVPEEPVVVGKGAGRREGGRARVGGGGGRASR